VKELRIYCEGGGDGPGTKDPFHEGMRSFLKPVIDLARSKRIRFNLTVCGGRRQTYDNFKTAISIHRDAFNVLLVDAEAPVTPSLQNPWQHLKKRDDWNSMSCVADQCYLMVQVMEAWFIADLDALKKFYGQGFNANPIPNNPNVEEIAKEQLEAALKKATGRTQPGEYQKIRHGAKLLARIDRNKVRRASRHCDRLFTTLETKLK